jgi:hypothetical protein
MILARCASLCVELGRCCMRGRETASGRMEKSAVLAPVPKQKVSIVEREGPGWTVWLDSQGDADCPICGTGPDSRHGSYVRPLRDLPVQGTSVLIQATRRVAGSPRAPRFTCHKMGCGAIGMPRRPSARVPHRVKQSRFSGATSKVGSDGCGVSRGLRPPSASVVEAMTSSAPFSGPAPALLSLFPPAAVGCLIFAARSAGTLDMRKAQERRPQQPAR